MTEYSLGPWYGVVSYNSPWGAHKMTIPTTQWGPGIGGGTYGGYLGQDGSTINDAETVWGDFADVLKVFHIPGTTIREVSVFEKPTPESSSILRAIIPLNVVGTNAGTTQAKAVQQTFNGKSTLYHPFKIVILDGPVGSSFDKILHAAFGAADLALEGFLSDLTHPFAARDGAAVAGFQSKTLTLNDKLRKEYGMA